jgi:hypothetical protein
MSKKTRPLLRCIAVVALVLCAALSGCAGKPQIYISSGSIPAGRRSLDALLPSAVPGTLLFACSDYGSGPGRHSAGSTASFTVQLSGAELEVLPLEGSKLPRDQRAEALLPEGDLLATLNPGGPQAQAVIVGFRPRDASPDNFAQVMQIAGLPGMGICDVDQLGNIYLRIRHEGDLTELWVGSTELRRVDMPEHIVGMGEYRGSLGRQVLVVLEDGTLRQVEPATATLSESAALGWVSTGATAAGRSLADLRYIAANEQLALLRFSDDILALSAKGAQSSLRLFSPQEQKPDGTPRSSEEAAKLAQQPQQLLAEAAGLPADLVSKSSNCVALTPEALAVVDRDYARVLLVLAEGPKAEKK